ncbi:MAG: DUF421 domain-containing protein [Clostridiales bacterium]|nr:DUF421 domain-containing protein [Clostridiales bacterium]
MFNLFIRTVIIYLLVFAVLRLMGKRQISDMQPFDLVITLLIADVASVPLSDVGIPLLYGAIPILALFVLHRLFAFAALRSQSIRDVICGKPVIVIAKGVVLEDAMKAANYTMGDLTEQLRVKDVFSLSEVEYGILETNGSLSVLKSGDTEEECFPSVPLVLDGKIDRKALSDTGRDENWLRDKLSSFGGLSPADCLFVFLEPGGVIHAQEKMKKTKPKARLLKVSK